MCLPGEVKLVWTHLWKSRAYRTATAEGRRLIEIRFSAARALRAKRTQARPTQSDLARLIGVAQPTISKIERAHGHAAFDIAVRALIALGCNDDEIADAFNAGRQPGIRRLRERAKEKFFPRPRPSGVAGRAARP